jgi:ferredoxin
MDWMEKIPGLVLPAEGTIILLFFIAVFLTSVNEREQRAAYLSLAAGFLLSLPFLLPSLPCLLHASGGAALLYPATISLIISLIPPVFVLVFFLPFRGKIDYVLQYPSARFDERDTMFSRSSLVPGTRRYEEYYARRPGNKSPDNSFRRKPGLLKAGTKFYDPILFAAAGSIFDRVIGDLHPRVEGEPEAAKTRLDKVVPGEVTRTLLEMAVNWGAHSAGVTELRDYHVYSVGGMVDRYCVAFGVDHKFALALTVEMDYDMMRTAPAAPTVLESARQYLQSGMIAVQLAEFIRTLGYPARAHIDGNYKVICPLVARDAGLGEIGRMGLLMTSRLGPRCRIAVVTTDLPLVPVTLGVNKRRHVMRERQDPVSSAMVHPGETVHLRAPVNPGATVIDFCRHCKKCATVCPGQSIPRGPEKETGGVKRWQIDHVSCYTYWCQAGTDCGRCMSVCPFSHPDNWFHNLVRYGIRNNLFFRRLALPLDNLFYGKRPKSRKNV